MARELFKGDLPVLILAILAEAPCHGYSIAREIERRSEGAFGAKEGALYPALRALEQKGFIEGSWEEKAGPTRKTYRLTQNGVAELEKSKRDWKKYASAFEQVLGGENVPIG
ncbi:MAG: PadR family transcriptional regulator [Armatimonadetes bacterium]|nr:PadR family transcriptional regulator [Armatimonadota bacterium]